METSPTERDDYSAVSVQLLSHSGLIILFIFLILGIWNNITAVVILLSILFAAVGIAKFWSHYSLRNVFYERLLSESRTFQGENIQLTIRVSNNKLLPLAWLDINDKLPTELPILLAANEESLKSTHIISIALSGYKRASWHYKINCNKRGYYKFGPANLHSGDIFGFYPRSVIIPDSDHLIVYPRIFSLDSLELPTRQPLGELKAQYRIFQDPTRTIGVREYIPGDPFNHINWKATARHQQLQVKEFEPSTTLQNIIWLGVDSFAGSEKKKANDDFEWAISTVASIANYLINKGAALGFFTNTNLARSNNPITVMPGTSPQHMVHILEILARITLKPIDTLETLINKQKGVLPWGATLIFIVSEISNRISRILEDLSKSGYQVVLIQTGNMTLKTGSHNYTTYTIKTYGDITRQNASLVLEKVA